MSPFKSALLVTFFSCLTQTFAYTAKEGNITATFGPYLFKTDYNGTHANSPWVVAPGLVVVGDISTKGALEIGIFHMNKRYIRFEGDKYLVQQTQVIHIGMGYRWWHSPYFSTSLSFFSAYPMEKVKTISSDFAQDSTFKTSAADKTEYGFDIAAQGELWRQGRYAAVLDVRYSLSVTNRTNERSNHFGSFLGLRYFIQSKEESSKK